MHCARKGYILFCTKNKNKHSDSTKKFSETDIIKMLEFLNDKIFAMFGGRVFQQTGGRLMATNCALLLADLFLYSCAEDLKQGLLKKIEKKSGRFFSFTFRYINDVFSLKTTQALVILLIASIPLSLK